MKKRHEHTANGKEPCIETYTYTYDHGERLVTVTHQLTVNGNTLPQVTLYSREYDEVGRLKANKLHGQESLKQNYGYNVRSWITSISGNNLDMELQYSYSDGIPRYNGNISYMMWRSGNETNYREYDFSYDGLDRLVAANYSGEGDYSTSYSYDKNGNILSLQRYGNGLIDNLTYDYNGNQLTKVEDATGNATGFTNGASQANEYTYDANGNLTKDSNKGIASITYNSLNLPQVVTFSNGNTITYLYTADGRKLRTVHVINGTALTTDYCGNVIYENGTQKLLLTEEGYINLNSPTTYYYYLKDHQGNNRVVINNSGTVQEVNHYYPFGSTFATSNVQPYKYNGKELDTKNGLNWYDYGARHYDAVLGRWHVMDPLADKYHSISPYGYCLNNPIKLIDTDGKRPRIYVETNGLGHTFVTTGTGKNTIVYTYGRYGALDGNKSSMRSLSRTGEGVLIIMKGDEAINYIKDEILNKEAHVYEFTSGNDDKVENYFNELFNDSEVSPSEGKYKNSENAKVIDTYDLWNNNCTTKSAEAISLGTDGKIDINSNSPSNIDTQLHYKSQKEDSEIKRIKIGKIIDEYDLFKK